MKPGPAHAPPLLTQAAASVLTSLSAKTRRELPERAKTSRKVLVDPTALLELLMAFDLQQPGYLRALDAIRRPRKES